MSFLAGSTVARLPFAGRPFARDFFAALRGAFLPVAAFSLLFAIASPPSLYEGL